MLEISGDYLEGGGQILRTAIGLSALTGISCRIVNIRKNRPKQGLAAQHTTGIKAVAQICNAELHGAETGSTEVEFIPKKIIPGDYSFDVGTAGSVTLVLQALLIPSIGSGKKFSFSIKGGTDVSWSPTTTYMSSVCCRLLAKIDAEISLETSMHGFYPKGGGIVVAQVGESRPAPLTLIERIGEPVLDCLSIASDFLRESNVAERQLASAKQLFPNMSGGTSYVKSLSPGSAITMHAHYDNCILGAGCIGERGKRAEDVGAEAAKLLKKQLASKACIDEWMSDQILPYLAMAAEKGPSTISVAETTRHAITNIWVIEKFLPVKFSVKGKEGEPGIISVEKDQDK
ncbi:MAG: RNA 3'-terminal phosphate cyclase [Candidatus Aenigmarchaeota archaeon]|nr:RNA 3'-terminal phosphate cyclase [Candidatus Aenigmarchaeota archaeon]